jgi:hypothetical protein
MEKDDIRVVTSPEEGMDMLLASVQPSCISLYCRKRPRFSEIEKAGHFTFKLVSSHESKAGLGMDEAMDG